ncbi:MAG TPA: hypothetical protein VLC09_00015, partial [Polyangiaceae bacterium]|nr:hypothetical protein [Polyangiaceae bacterium]
MKIPGWLLTTLSVGLAAGGVVLAKPKAAAAHAELRKTEEFYALPGPQPLLVLSLGYRSALAELLFARTLVDSGIHFVERRVFAALPQYLAAVVALDPTYRDVYYYADSLLTLSTVIMPKANYRIARDLQEQGRKQFPDDAELWLSSGMYMAYLAPPHLPPNEDAKEWRVAAARVLQHGCDIWPDGTELPPTCLSASTILNRAGETAANVSALQRLLAIADDPSIRAEALARLTHVLGVAEAEKAQKRLGALSAKHEVDLP